MPYPVNVPSAFFSDMTSPPPPHMDAPTLSTGTIANSQGVGKTTHEGKGDCLIIPVSEGSVVRDSDPQYRSGVVDPHMNRITDTGLSRAAYGTGAHLSHRQPDLVKTCFVEPRPACYCHGDQTCGTHMFRRRPKSQRDSVHAWPSPVRLSVPNRQARTMRRPVPPQGWGESRRPC
jgi:hypothetical protein